MIHNFMLKPRSKSVIVRIFVPTAILTAEAKSAVGIVTHLGSTGLVYTDIDNTNQFAYKRDGETAHTAVTAVTMTEGTWASGGFILVDDSDMPGVYEFGIPNACLVGGGARWCNILIPFAGTVAGASVFIHIDLIRSLAY